MANNALLIADRSGIELTQLERSRLGNIAAGFSCEEIASFARPRILPESVARSVRRTLDKIPE